MATIKGTPWLGDTQDGTDFNDTFLGSSGTDTFIGRYGNDTIKGAAGHDYLYGGEGVDLIYGGRGNDTLSGDAGYGNHLEGATGNDYLYSQMFDGSWSELVGGRGADVFGMGILEGLSQREPELHSWTDIRDFRAGQGDKLQLSFWSAPDSYRDTAETFALFDDNDDGRIDNADASATWDGRTLQVSSDTATIVLWNVDHIDSSMLIG